MDCFCGFWVLALGSKVLIRMLRSHIRATFEQFTGPCYRKECWSMDGTENYLIGWSIWGVDDRRVTATADLYGEWFTYLLVLMKNITGRLAISQVKYEMINIDAGEFSLHLLKGHYAKIDVNTDH
jgi:hypothetical protein